ncbi:MAG TPA: DNA translocase FtsK 4TM domain-containing protein, partial [Anaerolineales bacterium]|nr:DNA translocase FtsK 4TM domain-containing protein [Anaerolineales bacterium]
MPLKTPSSASSKSGVKPKGKAVTSSRGKNKATPKKNAPAQQPVVSISWWERLSAERKLDVVGAAMSVVGLLTLLVLFSAQRSNLTGTVVSFLTQLLGWGIYLLPVGLILMGLWLIFRRIEKLPALTLERATGILLFFLWLLTAMHAIAIPLELAVQAAAEGWGGGFIGSSLERVLFNSFGTGGAIVALLAWLLITLTMILDIAVRDLFGWVGPLMARVRQALAEWKPRKARPATPKVTNPAPNGYTPLNRPEPVIPAMRPGVPVTTVKSAEAVINWQLPDVKKILDEGSAPSVNEEFIQQRARLIQETLASFGAPVQVVEINRGPTITQFGVEPLFVETRSGRTRVRVNKIASLADDLALALAAPRIRIQAPVP